MLRNISRGARQTAQPCSRLRCAPILLRSLARPAGLGLGAPKTFVGTVKAQAQIRGSFWASEANATPSSVEVVEADAVLELASLASTSEVAVSPPQPSEQADSAEPWWRTLIGWTGPAVKTLVLAALVVSLVLSGPADALAKGSGGRVGGRSFSGGGGTSRSYSSGGSHSYGGSSSRSYSGGGGSSYRSYSSPGIGLGSGFGFGMSPWGYAPAPSVYVSPGYSSGVMVAPRVSPLAWWWDTLSTLVFLGFTAVVVASIARGPALGGALDGAGAVAAVRVTRVQVALLSSARAELQSKFEALAEEADTGSRAGLHSLLQESLLVLLRRPECFAYGGVDVRQCSDARKAESEVEGFSLEERSRFSEVTRSNYQGRHRRQPSLLPGTGGGWGAPSPLHKPTDELVVVTLLVAARDTGGSGKGGSSSGVKGGWAGIKAALKELGAVRAEDVMAVELLWTPDDPEDTFSRRDLLEDYPHLAPL
ncbi:hypothetical protein HYH03_001183 [Edaphochlamys debaryana]|uniref:Uncharacterized protein n=1 Tax=Edaphochlamys debaryana TaxID=47281 RepID=A0A835YI55_9CHLO|nr:hypothetical protein HYH03_001183 [Edaphochlamys debaryana]|eukprot:KAG2501396.1 hypothetical protein HYH03_001183 [Edaphochlamys debaryana]